MRILLVNPELVESQKILENISYTQDYAAIKNCDLVIEAATENISLKKKIFASSIFGDKFNPFTILSMLSLSKKIQKSDFLISTNWPSNIAAYLSRIFFKNKNT